MCACCQRGPLCPCLFNHLSGWTTSSEAFLSPGGLQNTRHQAFQAAVISLENTAGVRDELDFKEPDATCFLVNPEEGHLEQEIIIRKRDCFEGHICLLSSTFKQSAKQSAKSTKLSCFYSILLLAQDFAKPELLNLNPVSQAIHGHFKLICVLVLHLLASLFFLG